MSEWQTIETAPKNGTWPLLGYWNEANKWRAVIGQWFSQEQINDEWEDPPDDAEGWYEISMNASAYDVLSCWEIKPQFWQPYPKPPSL